VRYISQSLDLILECLKPYIRTDVYDFHKKTFRFRFYDEKI